MKVLLFILLVVGFIILQEEIKKLNANIKSNYKIDMDDITSIIVSFGGVIVFFVAYTYRNEWSIDNTFVTMLIGLSMSSYILYKNIKNTNPLLGLWITAYQIVIGILFMFVIITIINFLFPDKSRRKN